MQCITFINGLLSKDIWLLSSLNFHCSTKISAYLCSLKVARLQQPFRNHLQWANESVSLLNLLALQWTKRTVQYKVVEKLGRERKQKVKGQQQSLTLPLGVEQQELQKLNGIINGVFSIEAALIVVQDQVKVIASGLGSFMAFLRTKGLDLFCHLAQRMLILQYFHVTGNTNAS
jgi:hypothetical protein